MCTLIKSLYGTCIINDSLINHNTSAARRGAHGLVIARTLYHHRTRTHTRASLLLRDVRNVEVRRHG